ncbi:MULTISPECIES: tRNA glutamyl-Q(34) synthetase GluQRS [Methylophaga]|uniref:Glutamyl-Q tRNA(Asp) synthetase n=1 Tax=Methylophaga muralis TaxID=291169 RepID=A0A1E3GT81_9GAMM|nr:MULTISPECIES: tRNA glutamyl-Q(34) synthetase GluQRS [Methylophaga]ODN67282.1 Glutamyl-Q tRNA(Asp) synthetase [Methylophaga muralis]THF56170.1 MAG: tRNA glutamyl-Q(34) synthetase GluQRS [Methylophaga nitratireducenticrescens]THK42552.1 tRNA glutamyl-Q(34) synthetase GluQRS [Methylophaga sp. SB9B]
MNSDLTAHHYIGRFAPSPTGPLHFGSLVTATASFLDARSNGGKWLVRMEDLDKPREVVGAAKDILDTLESFGFHWDDEVLFQSQRTQLYQNTLEQLQSLNLAYTCGCSRKEINASAVLGIDGPVYPGFCRQGLATGKRARTWRLRVNDQPISFEDLIQGEQSQLLSQQVGDFVIRRGDGLFAYQLAVVVDDALQGITHIVRGADLLDSTPRQLFLQQQLGFTTPAYAHVPIATNLQGEKLSKQTRAQPVKLRDSGVVLCRVLRFLGLQPPIELAHVPLDELWKWAIQHWQVQNVPKLRRQVTLIPTASDIERHLGL